MSSDLSAIREELKAMRAELRKLHLGTALSVSVDDAAALIGLSVSNVRQLAKAYEITNGAHGIASFKSGSRRLFRVRDLERWVEELSA